MTRRELRISESDFRRAAANGELRLQVDTPDNGMRRRSADVMMIRRRALALVMINLGALALLLHAII